MRFTYGTAGFRSEGSILASTVFRAGILAALRSLKTGSTVGLMITASHNPVSDNGVKIADPDGGMMIQQWESFADALANAPDPEHLLQVSTLFHCTPVRAYTPDMLNFAFVLICLQIRKFSVLFSSTLLLAILQSIIFYFCIFDASSKRCLLYSVGYPVC